MKVRTTIIVIIITLTFVFFGIGNGVIALLFSNYLENQENAQINAISIGMGSYLNEINKRYQATIDDYSHWDDTYAYFNNQKQDFIDANFGENTFETLNINFVLFVEKENTIKYQQYYDMSTDRFIPFPSEVNIRELVQISKSMNMPTIIQFGNHFYIIASSQVSTSKNDKLSNGIMITGKMLDHAFINDLASIANGSIAISVTKNSPGSVITRVPSTEINAILEPIEVVKENDQIKVVFTIPHTADTGTSVLLSLSKTRDIYKDGIRQMIRFILIYTIILLLIFSILFYLLGRYISHPLKKIIRDVTSLDLSKNDIEKLEVQGTNEFSILGNSINTMLYRIESEQQKVKENEEKLLTTVDMLNNILDSIQDGFFELDWEWRFTYVNQRSVVHLGLTTDNIGKCIWDLVPYLINSQLENIFRQVMETRIPRSYQLKGLINKNLWCDVRIYPTSAGISVFCRDITKNKRYQEALRKSEAQSRKLAMKLTQADNRKNEFLAMLSHELRNPLASITLGFSLLDRSVTNGEQARLARETIDRQIVQLTHLIDDLLDISRITERKITIKKAPVELYMLIDNIIQGFIPEFLQKGVHIEFESAQNSLYVQADKTRLTQIFNNILKNAVKYTHSGGNVSVRLSVDSSSDIPYAVIRILDDGIGIDQHLLPDLFLPFTQADNSLDRSQGGLGLGLSIVKHFVEMHGGSVTAHSDGLDKGTEFTVRLPLLTEYKCIQEKQPYDNDQPHRSLRVLVIDDISDVADILCSLLKEIGHEAVSAANGIDGLIKAKEIRPDVIICDIGLPGMTGYEVAASIRSDNHLKDVYLIALSGYAQLEDQEKAKKAGFNCHLAKPVDLARLEIELNKV